LLIEKLLKVKITIFS